MAKEKEKENLFLQNAEGKSFYEFDAREIKDFIKLFDVKRNKLDKRNEQFNEKVDENVPNETSANDSNAGETNDGHT
ncbi:putative outer envelope pore protein 16-1, chloroplastic-like [Capsicum annuum]|nr:putative outer envelope pore protein 16-1, chloroplastic-like [Capsicum annuum]